jgi:hypothetical protein
MARFLVLALLLFSPLLASQGIYRTTDEDGNVIFTDAPPAGSSATEEVGMQPINTAPPARDVPPSERTTDEPAGEPEYKVLIVKPPNETTIPMGPGNFSVSASTDPPLKKYESLQLFMDGEPRGSPQPSGFWDLTNVFRGAHDITVGVINAEGETVGMSEPTRVYVQRPSVNFKNR